MQTAHVPNTGSLLGVLQEGQECLVTKSADPKRKLPFTLQALRTPHSWVGVNTQLPNHLVEEAFLNATLARKGVDRVQREYKLNAKTRLDFALFKRQKLTGFIEVKNVTLADGECALFPDCATARGLKHLEELSDLTAQGINCEMLFVVQRSDCTSFAPATQIDPKYAEGLSRALAAGVKISAYKTKLDAFGIELLCNQSLQINL